MYTKVRDDLPARYVTNAKAPLLIANGCVIEGTVINSALSVAWEGRQGRGRQTHRHAGCAVIQKACRSITALRQAERHPLQRPFDRAAAYPIVIVKNVVIVAGPSCGRFPPFSNLTK